MPMTFKIMPLAIALGLLVLTVPAFAENQAPVSAQGADGAGVKAAPRLATQRQGIIVWRLEAKTDVSDKDIDSISGYITAEVEKLSGLKAVSDADIKTIVSGEEKRQQCGADSTSCISEIGSALGVPEAVSGDLGKMGDYWMLNLRRLNVRKAEVMARAGRQIKGDVNALIEAIPSAVAELFGKEHLPSAGNIKSGNAAKPSKKMNAYQVSAYSTFFPGLALVVVGGLAQWQMNKAKSDYDSGNKRAKDRHAIWKSVSATNYALGGAAMATGIVLWIVDAAREKSRGTQAMGNRAVGGISPVHGGATMQFRVSW